MYALSISIIIGEPNRQKRVNFTHKQQLSGIIELVHVSQLFFYR